jgi:hypothetical protein
MSNSDAPRRRSVLRLPMILVILTAIGVAAGSVLAGAITGGGDSSITACEDLPGDWQAASDFGLSADRQTAILTWPASEKGLEPETVTVAVSDTHCQEGFAAKTNELVEFATMVNKRSCGELQQLADGIRAAQPDAKGWVDVPYELDQAIYGENISEKYGPEAATEHRVDLVEVDRVLSGECTEALSR